jgi:diguanylate cyclase (GGDEF)-like protein
MHPSPEHSLNRLKWAIMILSIVSITLIEAFLYRFADNYLPYLISWAFWLVLTIWATLAIFRTINRFQEKRQKHWDEINNRAKRQDALIQFNTKLSSALDESAILKLVIGELRNTFGFESVALNLFENPLEADRLTEKEAGAGDGAQNKPAVSGFDLQPARSPQKIGRATRVVAPLRAANEVLGNLVVERSGGRVFSPPELSVVYHVADQASLALQNARRWVEQQQKDAETELRQKAMYDRERYLTQLNRITRDVLRGQSFHDLLQTVTDDLVELFAADGSLLALWDEERKQLLPTTASALFRQLLNNDQISPLDVAFALSVLGNGRARMFRQPERPSQETPRLINRLHCSSILGLPLIADDQKLGVAFVAFQSRDELSNIEIGFGGQAASQIALGIAKTRALTMAQHRAKELDALQRATAALLATIELEELLGQILDAAMSATPNASKGTLYLVTPETGQLQIRAAHGYSDPRIRLFRPTSSESFSAQAVRYRRPILVDDVRIEAGVHHEPDLPDSSPVLSLIVAPLLLGEKALGAIELGSFKPHDFIQSDLQLLVSFAATATTAINNAQLHSEVQKQAVTDTLTSLYNRRGLFEMGEREILRSQRFGRPLSAILFDIDQFKEINDTHGHGAGDEVLKWISAQFQAELRQVDLIARYGGDEFLALLSETDLTDAHLIADRLRSKISQMAIPAGDIVIKITLSAGVATVEANDDLQKLIERADRALYRAKQSGKNQVVVEFRS